MRWKADEMLREIRGAGMLSDSPTGLSFVRTGKEAISSTEEDLELDLTVTDSANHFGTQLPRFNTTAITDAYAHTLGEHVVGLQIQYDWRLAPWEFGASLGIAGVKDEVISEDGLEIEGRVTVTWAENENENNIKFNLSLKGFKSDSTSSDRKLVLLKGQKIYLRTVLVGPNSRAKLAGIKLEEELDPVVEIGFEYNGVYNLGYVRLSNFVLTNSESDSKLKKIQKTKFSHCIHNTEGSFLSDLPGCQHSFLPNVPLVDAVYFFERVRAAKKRVEEVVDKLSNSNAASSAGLSASLKSLITHNPAGQDFSKSHSNEAPTDYAYDTRSSILHILTAIHSLHFLSNSTQLVDWYSHSYGSWLQLMCLYVQQSAVLTYMNQFQNQFQRNTSNTTVAIKSSSYTDKTVVPSNTPLSLRPPSRILMSSPAATGTFVSIIGITANPGQGSLFDDALYGALNSNFLSLWSAIPIGLLSTPAYSAIHDAEGLVRDHNSDKSTTVLERAYNSRVRLYRLGLGSFWDFFGVFGVGNRRKDIDLAIRRSEFVVEETHKLRSELAEEVQVSLSNSLATSSHNSPSSSDDRHILSISLVLSCPTPGDWKGSPDKMRKFSDNTVSDDGILSSFGQDLGSTRASLNKGIGIDSDLNLKSFGTFNGLVFANTTEISMVHYHPFLGADAVKHAQIATNAGTFQGIKLAEMVNTRKLLKLKFTPSSTRPTGPGSISSSIRVFVGASREIQAYKKRVEGKLGLV